MVISIIVLMVLFLIKVNLMNKDEQERNGWFYNVCVFGWTRIGLWDCVRTSLPEIWTLDHMG